MTPEVVLDEWHHADPAGWPALGGVWPDDEAVARDLGHLPHGALLVSGTRGGLRVQARQHVGVVRLGPIQVRIRPKLPPGDLWTAVGWAMGLTNLTRLPPADHVLDGDFVDLLCALLLAEAEQLWRAGIHRGYTSEEAWLSSPRGRPDLAVLARNQPLTRAALPCRHHHLTAEVAVNQMVVGGLDLARRLAQQPTLRSALHRAWQQWASACGPARLDYPLLKRAEQSGGRLTRRYDGAHALVRLLIAGRGLGELHGDEEQRTSLPGFLWDMARLWEAFLTRFLSEFLVDATVQPQRTLGHLFAVRRSPSGWSTPRPRPDLVVLRKGRPKVVVDAKYRDILDRGLPRDILYQLSVYALAWSQGEATVPALGLCPTLGDVDEVDLVVRPPGQAQRRVLVRGVRWDAALAALRSGDETRCRALAEAWAAV